MERPINVYLPHSTYRDKPKNILPHILRNKDYDMEWLLWARNQKYLDRLTLKSIENRIHELTKNG